MTFLQVLNYILNANRIKLLLKISKQKAVIEIYKS